MLRVALNTKTTAALCGMSVQTLCQARCMTRRSARHDVWTPPHTYIPKRVRPAVVYLLADLLQWSKARGRPLHWHDLPLCVVLPTVDALRGAGLPLPEALAARAGAALPARNRPAPQAPARAAGPAPGSPRPPKTAPRGR